MYTMPWDEDSDGRLECASGKWQHNLYRAIGKEGCGSMNNNREATWILHDIQSIDQRDTLPTPWNSQVHLVHSQWERQEPDKPPDDQCNMENIVAWCQSQKRKWCRWPPSSHSNPETEAQVKWAWQSKKTAVWCNKSYKEPTTKNTFALQLKNKCQALAETEKHAPPSTSDINTKWEHIRVAYTQTIEACLGHRRGGSGSQQIPGKPLRAGEPWRRKSWTPDQRDWKRDTGSSTEKQIGRWRGWKGLTSRPTWNMWQVKQKRPPTKENNDRCTRFPRS